MCDDWFEDHLIESRNPSSQKLFNDCISPFCSSLTVDVETGELEPSLSSADRTEQDREVSEMERIHDIRRLSQTLIDRWSKLPVSVCKVAFKSSCFLCTVLRSGL